MRDKLNALLKRDDISFLVAGILMFFLFIDTPYIGDDAIYISEFGTYGLGEAFHTAAERVVYEWYTWSSRILVNFTSLSSIILGSVFFAVVNGVFTYIFLKAISIIFRTKAETNVKLTCLFFLFPFVIWTSAGWYATMATYYWPVVLGVVSLIPIAKHIRGERIRAWEYVVYSIALLHCANTEQGMVFVLLTYSVFCVYCLKKRIFIWYLAVQEGLSILSMLVCMLNPGNNTRKVEEVWNWFPDYDSLSSLDKVDMGVSTTFSTLLHSNYILVIAICVIMLCIICRMYQDFMIRFLAGMPLCITVLLGPLKDVVFTMFPQLSNCVRDLPRTGTVNVETYGLNTYRLSFFLVAMACMILVFNIVLIFGRDWKTYLLLSLIMGGAAGRFAMGFSPTLYASGIRTFSNLLLLFVVVGSALIARYDEIRKPERSRGIVQGAYYIGTILGICNLAAALK